MALSNVRALLVARGLTVWNRLRREAGTAGIVGTGTVVFILLLVVIMPGALCLRLGLDLGGELSTSSDPTAVLPSWNAIQAIFTILFGIAGGLRHAIAFPEASIRWLPIRPRELLLAEMPASLGEVFPLLGMLGIVATNLGLALRMPAMSPFIVLVALLEIVAMCALIMIVGSLRRGLARRKIVLVALAVGLMVAANSIGPMDARSFVRSVASTLVAWWPTSLSVEGLVLLRTGGILSGSFRLVAGVMATIVLFWIAAKILGFERTLDASSTRSVRNDSFRFRGATRTVAALFRKELLDTRTGRAMLVIPLLMSGPFAIFMKFAEFDRGRRNILAEMKDLPLDRIEAMPALAIFLVLVVLLDAQIWMNQFGWDRKAISTYFQLPIEAADVMVGKFIGLVHFVVLQALIGLVPIVWVHRASLREALSGLAAAVIVLVGATAVGQAVSVRFPRAVERDGGSNVPIYLSWISTVLSVAGVGVVVGIHAIGSQLGNWGGAITLLVASIAAVGGYLALSRVLGEHMRRNDERLLAM